MCRYKVRAERSGAFVFDQVERQVFSLSSQELVFLLGHIEGLSSGAQPPGTLHAKAFFGGDGRPDFYLIAPLQQIAGLEGKDCLDAPQRIYMELTRACNLCCRMCYNAAGCPLPHEMSTAEVCSLIDEMDLIGVFEARLTGGEPTLRSDFLDILDYVLTKSFYVSLATNGFWDEGLTQEICQRRLDDVIVSLEGPQEINDWFRAGGSYQITVRSIKALKESGKKVRLNTVLSHWNWQHIEPLFQLADEYNLLLIDFIHPRPFGRGNAQAARELMLTAEETLSFNQIVRELRKKYRTKVVMDFDLLRDDDLPRHPIAPRIFACPAGREFAFVSPQGNVFPCGVAPVHDIEAMTEEQKRLFIAGNVREQSLLEIWHTSPVWDAFRDLQQCKPPQCFSCRFWGKKCFGTCPVGAYYHEGTLNGQDPYCYAHLL